MSFELVPILGGTFDPIHHGHLRCALEISEWLGRPVRMLPSRAPAHRPPPRASARQRWEMLVAATGKHPQLIPDDQELRRSGATYSVDTLTALRAAQPDRAFAFIIGADAFAGLTQWHRWETLVTLTHFILVGRPGHSRNWPPALAAWAAGRFTDDPADLCSAAGGAVVEVRITPLEISATRIRELARAGHDPAFLVPQSVRRYLADNAIYR